jgi:hypothetical protein
MKKKMPIGLMIPLLIIGLYFRNSIIGFVFKTLTKASVVMQDISILKKDSIDKLNKMDAEEFQRQYTKVLHVRPFYLKFSYIVKEHMTKEQVIKDIESLDKKKIYAIIDSIPDKAIIDNFKQYLSNKKQEILNSNIVKQINKLWNKMIINVERK